MIDPDQTLDDSIVVKQTESVAPFVIKGNQGPILFIKNKFAENIGTTGGAIHIEDPEFRYSDSNPSKNPFIVLSENRFTNNMAYWAGNAFHIQMTASMHKAPTRGVQTRGARAAQASSSRKTFLETT